MNDPEMIQKKYKNKSNPVPEKSQADTNVTSPL
jgi:hypothetical protein